MYISIFLYAAVAFLVLLLFHTEAGTLIEYAMAQEEQSSNQSQIVMAQTPEEKANLERFDNSSVLSSLYAQLDSSTDNHIQGCVSHD